MEPRSGISIFAVLAFGLVACAEGVGGDIADREYPDDKADSTYEDLLIKELTEKYGVRPRRYNGFFNGDNEAERRFAAHLPSVTDELNQIAAGLGFGFELTQTEVAVNFISEGGYFLLIDGITDSSFDPDAEEPGDDDVVIDGFFYLGVDTFYDNINALEPWITEGLWAGIEAGEIFTFPIENELGQTVNTIIVQTIEQGLEANALVLAWSRSIFAKDLAALGLGAPEDLEPEARFFWSTMYFNAGPGFAQRQLRENGVGYWKKKWTGGDDPTVNSRYARYNALWRTASFEFMDRTHFAAAQE